MSPRPVDQTRTTCPNCGVPLVGPFCAHCGQRNTRRLVSVRRLVQDAVEDQLSLSSSLPRSLVGLLRPGFLTREYTAGRVVRYIPPFRLYLITSLLFFVALAWTADVERLSEEILKESGAASDSVAAGVGASAADSAVVPADSTAEAGDDQINIQLVGMDTADAPRWMRPVLRRLEAQEARLNSMEPRELLRLAMLEFERQAPKAVFLLIPVYALLMKLLYLRRRRLYAEHFIYSLHVHAFAFLVFTAMLLLPSKAPTWLLLLWLAIYIFLAMRRVYGQGVLKTAMKYWVLFIGYSTAFGLVFAVALLLTAISM